MTSHNMNRKTTGKAVILNSDSNLYKTEE